jgi:tetratricopeptide (TPR) repeat protein
MVASLGLRAARDLLSPLGVALVLTAAILFFGGGSGSGFLTWIGGAAVVAAVALAVTRGAPPGWTTVIPLAALALWCALSIAWSVEPDRSWEYANRTLAYVAFAVIGLYVAGRTRALAYGLAALLGAVCVWSLAGKVLPWLYEDYGRIARLRSPVGYWNALALLGDVALPLGLWLATRRRVAGTLLVFGWLVALALTYSRGGMLVAALVIVAWLALAGAWLESVATLVAAGAPALVAVGVAYALRGVTSDGTSHATRVRDGLVFGAVLLLCTGAAALLARAPRPRETALVRRVAAGAAAVLVVAAVVVGALHASSAWSQFTSVSNTQLPQGPGRIAEAGSNHRWVWWKQAWHGFTDRPLAGSGAGSFALTNLRYRTTFLDQTPEPHDLPLQFLSETGIVGLALFVLAAAALVRRPPRDAAELALALALPAYLVHGLLDMDWDFAAVTAPAFLAAGALAARTAPVRRPSPFAALAATGVALAVLSSFLLPWLGSRWAGDAESALDRPAHAIALAKRARSVNPLAVEPLFVQALAEEVRGHKQRAYALLREATRIQPKNPEAWFRLGDFALTEGCPRLSLPPLEKFTELSPQDRGGAEYNRALAAVNSGKPRC